MRYAETGFNLEIDLSRGSIERVESDPELTELHLGGLGTSARILWDRVPPETEAFSEDNLLIFATGLLCGTAAPGCNRTIVSTFSPQTQLLAYSMMGGFWAPELKYAGYDKVIVRGKSPELVYLWIHNDKVEIRDASHLRGQGRASRPPSCIRQELKEPDAQVAAIGLAGENRVFFASIEQGRSSASRGGMGAVMGDKRLKAIAVRGTKDVNVARPAEFMELCNDVLKYIKFRDGQPDPGRACRSCRGSARRRRWRSTTRSGTPTTSCGATRAPGARTSGPTRSRRSGRDTQESVRTRLISCYNCPMKCGATISVPGQPDLHDEVLLQAHLHHGGLFRPGVRLQDRPDGHRVRRGRLLDAAGHGLRARAATRPASSPTRTSRACRPTSKAGSSGCSTGSCGARASATCWPTASTGRRERIGKGAEKFAHNTIKKHEQLPLKLGMLNPVYFLMYSHRREDQHHPDRGPVPAGAVPDAWKSARPSSRTGSRCRDEKFKQYLLDWEPRGEKSNPALSRASRPAATSSTGRRRCTTSTTPSGICAGLSSFPLKPPYHIHNFPKFISAGDRLSTSTRRELWKAATRNRTLLRAINVRRGMRRADEKPPEDHWKKRFPELEKKLLDAYYKLKGWNSNGIPTTESLHELDLDYVAEDLEQRGILSHGARSRRRSSRSRSTPTSATAAGPARSSAPLFHATPQYSSNNPARSRIRVVREPLRDIYLPVYAGEYTAAECTGRDKYIIDGKEYDECDFCRASCPSRDLFKEPDSGLPLKCDMCEDDPPLAKPMCVEWCLTDALIYEEREEEVEEPEPSPADIEIGLEALVDKHGLQQVLDTVARMSEVLADQRRTTKAGNEHGDRHPLQGDRRRHQGERRRCVQVLLPVRHVRHGLPVEPGRAASACASSCGEATFGLTEIESEDIWRCTTCGKCPQVCPRGVKQIESGVALRRIATEYDVFPHVGASRSAPSRASLRAEGNPFGEDRAKRAEWAEGLAVKPFTEGMEFLYFPGCYLSATTRGARRSPRATVEILNKAGVDFGILGAAGKLLRREHPQDRRRGAVQEPGAAEHQGLHRPRREEDPGVLAALLPHLQERVPRVHGALRGGAHLAVAPQPARRGPAAARRPSTRRR